MGLNIQIQVIFDQIVIILTSYFNFCLNFCQYIYFLNIVLAIFIYIIFSHFTNKYFFTAHVSSLPLISLLYCSFFKALLPLISLFNRPLNYDPYYSTKTKRIFFRTCNLTRVGSLVLIVHDVADIFLEVIQKFTSSS